MKVTPLPLEGLFKIEPTAYGDSRGFFFESWNQSRFEDSGLGFKFVQDSISKSARGVLRGLHFQNPNAQGKLISVFEGEVFDVLLDLRKSSKTFGQWTSISLSSQNHWQVYVPEGFAHGFQVVSEFAIMSYKFTDFYNAANEATVLWSDPALNIPWPIPNPSLSAKDLNGVLLKDMPNTRLFK